MPFSRMCSQAAAFCAAMCIAGAAFAQAVVDGGASLSVTGNVKTNISTSDVENTPIAIISSEGAFNARNRIDDFGGASAYVVRSDLNAGGRQFYDIAFRATPGEINAVLSGFGADVDDVAPFLSALVTGPDGSVLIPDSGFFSPLAGLDVPGVFTAPGLDFFKEFEGVAIAYGFDVDIATAERLSGTYSVSSVLTIPQLEALQASLVSAFGPIDFEDDFDFAFNASIAPVPLPAALPMLLGGLLLLGLLGRKRRAA